MNKWRGRPFGGAKVALFVGTRLLVIQRDDVPHIPWPGYWDLPGGGREGLESPLACVQRECWEELGLHLHRHQVTWQRAFATGRVTNWFFVARLRGHAVQGIVFGNEGRRWACMSVARYLDHPKAIPRFQHRLRVAMGFSDQNG